MYDHKTNKTFSINEDQLYISGDHFGGNKDECYIPIFNNKKHRKESEAALPAIYLGNIFLEKYYMVFDMSPLEKDLEYIQIGIGLRNKENQVTK